jgi:two-component system, cell cycle response regulator
MPRILTVDDSRAVRTIVSKNLKDLGVDIDEAEDGQQALERLEEIACDLILLDVTMPVMDGPTMLGKLRASGNHTPVIMLTSESKRSVVSEAMKLGIEDYILKPFKPEELTAKVRQVLKLGIPDKPQAAPSAAIVAEPSATDSGAAAGGGKRFVDVLVVDDMENVAKRLRSLLPSHVTLEGFTSAPSALGACRDRVYRVVLVDNSIPEVDSAVLAGQIKLLQPHATVLALALRSTNDVAAELKSQGFADVLFKPFTPESVQDFVMQFFDKQDFLSREDNVLKVGAFTGKADRADQYFTRLATLFPTALENVAAACFEDAIIDLTQAPTQAEKLPKVIAAAAEKAGSVGLTLRLIGPATMTKLLSGFEETRSIKVFPSLAEARSGAGA